MGNATLVIMAAGIGSRYGVGIKQLEKVGPGGELIIDYSVHDAIKAGFDKVICIIRKDIEDDFREVIGKRMEERIQLEYTFQEVEDIPDKYREKFQGRTKPWGTGQAILCCKDMVREPFLIINADDFYGAHAYEEAYKYITEHRDTPDRMELCMVGFVLDNTLSENGVVTRGICVVDEKGMLKEIVETSGIEREGDHAVAPGEKGKVSIPVSTPVSMNMWGIPPGFFSYLEKGFDRFLDELPPGEMKKEYLLPTIICDMLTKGELGVRVLPSHDKWFGVTYREDKESVMKEVRALIAGGMCPERLYD